MIWSSTLAENAWKSEEFLLLLIHEKNKPTVLSRMSVNYWEWILLKTTYQLANECLRQASGPPAIIVKFMRCDVKDNFNRARKQLKNLTTQDLGYSEKNKIYLAESLTERNRMLFKDCLKVKIKRRIWSLSSFGH